MAHRYWRVRLFADADYNSPDTHGAIAKVEMRATSGGADVATAANGIYSGDYFSTGNAPFDYSNYYGFYHGTYLGMGTEITVGQDFGAAQTIDEIHLKWGASYPAEEVRVEHSDDGINWTTALTDTSLASSANYFDDLTLTGLDTGGGGGGVTGTMAAQESGSDTASASGTVQNPPHRYCRVQVYQADGAIRVSNIDMRATSGGAIINTNSASGFYENISGGATGLNPDQVAVSGSATDSLEQALRH